MCLVQVVDVAPPQGPGAPEGAGDEPFCALLRRGCASRLQAERDWLSGDFEAAPYPISPLSTAHRSPPRAAAGAPAPMLWGAESPGPAGWAGGARRGARLQGGGRRPSRMAESPFAPRARVGPTGTPAASVRPGGPRAAGLAACVAAVRKWIAALESGVREGGSDAAAVAALPPGRRACPPGLWGRLWRSLASHCYDAGFLAPTDALAASECVRFLAECAAVLGRGYAPAEAPFRTYDGAWTLVRTGVPRSVFQVQEWLPPGHAYDARGALMRIDACTAAGLPAAGLRRRGGVVVGVVSDGNNRPGPAHKVLGAEAEDAAPRVDPGEAEGAASPGCGSPARGTRARTRRRSLAGGLITRSADATLAGGRRESESAGAGAGGAGAGGAGAGAGALESVFGAVHVLSVQLAAGLAARVRGALAFDYPVGFLGALSARERRDAVRLWSEVPPPPSY